MAVDDDDDHWPSLAPIKTSAATAASLQHACTDHVLCKNSRVQEGCIGLQDGLDAARPVISMRSCSPSASGRRTKAASSNLARRSSSCKKSCVNFLSCFSCAKQPPSPRPQPRCTLPRNGPAVRRSMAFLFRAGGLQSFYSSPTGKAAQLSGAFPRSLSAGKLHHMYASPRTPSGNQQFTSPRTPGSGRNLQCLSATPRTPAASGKVQHFAGTITSPRTPYGLGAAASPGSSCRRKSTFTLFMPPAISTADKKKAAPPVPQDEPTSPHVTCIGKVGRKSQCKKLYHKDVISPGAHCAKKNRKLPHSGSAKCHSTSSEEAAKISACRQLSTMEACKQKFGRIQLHNLYKIEAFGNDQSCNGNADFSAQAAVADLDCSQGDDNTVNVNGHKDLMHLDSQNNASNADQSVHGDMRSLQTADHDFPANISMHSIAINDDKEELADTAVLHTTSSQNPHQ